MNAKISIPDKLIREFCRQNHIQRLALFGSALREDFTDDSDIDILVEFEPGTKVGLSFFAMEEELSRILGRRVDLNTPGFLSDHFRSEVANKAILLYDSV
jgi:predicted nucleotidyltransferase